MTKIKSHLGKILSSETKVELLNLFNQNPSIIDTVDGIAVRIGKTGSAIKNDVEELEKVGFLRKKHIGHQIVFKVDPIAQKELQMLLEEYKK
jgi:predicted transcriptional regulator